jgi:hypothetical protein
MEITASDKTPQQHKSRPERRLSLLLPEGNSITLSVSP